MGGESEREPASRTSLAATARGRAARVAVGRWPEGSQRALVRVVVHDCARHATPSGGACMRTSAGEGLGTAGRRSASAALLSVFDSRRCVCVCVYAVVRSTKLWLCQNASGSAEQGEHPFDRHLWVDASAIAWVGAAMGEL